MKGIATITIILILSNWAFSQNFGIDESSPQEKLHVNGDLRVSTGEINSDHDHLSLMHGVRSDDNSYEWIGFYSGSTRQGIILYDGAWSGANNLTNEFSITAEGSNLLTLNTNGGHVAIMPDGAGNVGIGTISPTDKLTVEGNVLSKGVKNVSGSVSTYDVSTERYFIKGTYGADGGRTIPLDMGIVADLCGDEDGCRIRFMMRYWSGYESEGASDGAGQTGSYLFTYDQSNGRWRLGSTSGVDGNGSTQHIISIYSGACYFTDGNYSGYSGLGDPDKQLGLLIWNGAYNNAARTCELTLED